MGLNLDANIKTENEQNKIKLSEDKWLLNQIKHHRKDRNSKNIYKVMLIFAIQFTLLTCAVYSLCIGKIINGSFGEESK